MKRKLLIAATFLLSWSAVSAQGVLDAHKFSQTDLRGTARSMSMGGAFGALGGDISAIAINPAGIGVYKSSEIVTTLDFQNVENKSLSNLNQELKDNKFKVGFNNFAFVGTFPLYNDVAPLINFGFSYNKIKNFNRKYSMQGSVDDWSLADYMADRADNVYIHEGLGLPNTVAGRDDVWRTEDWLSVFGYNSQLVRKDDKGYYSSTRGLHEVDNFVFVEEKGSINTYDFNMGTTFEDMLSVGLTISVTDIDYRMRSLNKEDFYTKGANSTQSLGGYDLVNGIDVDGTGWGVGLGVIFKPIQELRIGVAYHSPTWYNMTENYYAEMTHELEGVAKGNSSFSDYKNDVIKSMDGDFWTRNEYKYRTPDKWVFSMAGVLGKNAIISVDYELVDHSKSNFKPRDNRKFTTQTEDLKGVTKGVKDAYKLTSMIRVGGEYRITPQFSGRVGYAWQQSPYSKKFEKRMDSATNSLDDWFDTPGSIPHYIIGKDTHYITWGLGYRFTRNIYTDVAFVYKTQKGDLYSHSMADKAELKENSFQGALTLGFRF